MPGWPGRRPLLLWHVGGVPEPGRQRPGRSRGRDAELAAESVGEPLIRHERATAVSGLRKQTDQLAVGALVERIEARSPAGERDRGVVIAGGDRSARQHAERLSFSGAVRVAGGEDPVLVESGEQLAAAEPERRLCALFGQQPVELMDIDPHLRLPGQGRSPLAWRAGPRSRSVRSRPEAPPAPSGGSPAHSRRARSATGARQPSSGRAYPGEAPAMPAALARAAGSATPAGARPAPAAARRVRKPATSPSSVASVNER